ncbi:hypothetical protein QR98_0001990 [Sarcoptes scabiei]|uniref:Uncharacterized protein n=1 Tax=Sarcoptes scabiei TaxID=52283 RepID=A0A131ZTH6_SARSC|nr:hypothetical protein QR98_0001990 [Sarcoptes scabiei]
MVVSMQVVALIAENIDETIEIVAEQIKKIAQTKIIVSIKKIADIYESNGEKNIDNLIEENWPDLPSTKSPKKLKNRLKTVSSRVV